MPIKPAFSAIELLIVAGIAAILTAIAVPGYMEAKVRAEVVDARKSVREVHNALILYKLDYNRFPPKLNSYSTPQPLLRLMNTGLLNQEPNDRFKTRNLMELGSYYSDRWLTFDYINPIKQEGFTKTLNRIQALSPNGFLPESLFWYIKSIGPDQIDFRDEGGGRLSNKINHLELVEYQPTNGIFSLGEIFSYGQY